LSFFTDPWLYNCRNNPYDDITAKREQRMIRAAHQRAMQYAHGHRVTMVSSAGNSNIDLGAETKEDTISPDYPPGSEYFRIVTNDCLDLPTGGPHALSISALGPSGRKAYYSNYGVEQIVVSAPGGDRRDFFGMPQYNTPETRILSTASLIWLQETGQIDANGDPTTPLVVKHCQGATCAYYTYFQGTSMSGPYAAGVAALIVSESGRTDVVHGGLGLKPKVVEAILWESAVDTPCPEQNPFDYPDLPEAFTSVLRGERRLQRLLRRRHRQRTERRAAGRRLARSAAPRSTDGAPSGAPHLPSVGLTTRAARGECQIDERIVIVVASRYQRSVVNDSRAAT
jgi:lantibiotic leader peptide-processing serine protease